MKHVAPHTWADAWAGKLAAAERAAAERHAAECPACAKVRERVTRASDSFASIRTQLAPDVGWDSVRAKVHWSVSTERRAKIAPSRAGWIAAGVCAVAGAAAVIFVDHPAPPAGPAIAVPDPTPTPTREPEPSALVGLVNRTTGDLMIDGIRATDPFATRLSAGTVIATGEGGVDVQFGPGSAFHLAPRSRLELVRFDDRTVELSIDGTVDIVLAPRTAQQTFVVRAGSRTVEVRGTQFRVQHAKTATAVACRHGLVAVRDDRGLVEVGAGRRIELSARDARLSQQAIVAMSNDEAMELAEATPIVMPVWDANVASSTLEIATSGRRHVRLDGVEVGEAPMRVRTMPGRHTVEVADDHGRYRRAGWVDVANAPARIEIQPEPPPTRTSDERRRQFRAGIDRGKVAECTRVAAKQGLLVGAYVQIEIGVDASGAVPFLNLLETDLPRKLADCIEGVLKEVRFKPGAAASWRERIDL